MSRVGPHDLKLSQIDQNDTIESLASPQFARNSREILNGTSVGALSIAVVVGNKSDGNWRRVTL